MAYIGDLATGKTIYLSFVTVKATGSPVALVSGAVRVIKNGLATNLHSTGVTLSAGAGSITGRNKVTVAMSGALYTSGEYEAILSTGSADGKNLRGYPIASWSIKARNRAGYSLVTGQHDAIGARTWAQTSRTLSSGAVVWTAAGRTLSSGSAVWSAATRSLTDEAGFTLTTGQHDSIATRTWAAASRLLTSGAAVWAAGTRSLTDKASFTLTTGQHDAIGTRVWANGTKVLTSGGVVWSAGTRTLTSGAVLTTAALTEQASVPAAAPSLGAAIQWNYQAIRNTRITTATADKIHTSATAVAGTAALSYVTGSTTFTKGKYA